MINMQHKFLMHFNYIWFTLGAPMVGNMILTLEGQIISYQPYIHWYLKTASLEASQTESRMPAGVSWPKYLKFFTAAMLTMLAGAQCVHLVYRPLEDMDEWVEKEVQKLQQTTEHKGHPPSQTENMKTS